MIIRAMHAFSPHRFRSRKRDEVNAYTEVLTQMSHPDRKQKLTQVLEFCAEIKSVDGVDFNRAVFVKPVSRSGHLLHDFKPFLTLSIWGGHLFTS